MESHCAFKTNHNEAIPPVFLFRVVTWSSLLFQPVIMRLRTLLSSLDLQPPEMFPVDCPAAIGLIVYESTRFMSQLLLQSFWPRSASVTLISEST